MILTVFHEVWFVRHAHSTRCNRDVRDQGVLRVRIPEDKIGAFALGGSFECPDTVTEEVARAEGLTTSFSCFERELPSFSDKIVGNDAALKVSERATDQPACNRFGVGD
ncbi:MAG: hypothetical protein LAP39_21195 [Acidobacteriia bacterium]|nr:hypothetical protein [Terriglobia bacterium]